MLPVRPNRPPNLITVECKSLAALVSVLRLVADSAGRGSTTESVGKAKTNEERGAAPSSG